MTRVPADDAPVTGRPLVIQKLFYDGSKSYRWVGQEISRDEHVLFFTAIFDRDSRDLGYVTFVKGDVFYEYYFFDRWYNAFQVYSVDGDLRGWYCNVTMPARVDGDELTFVDLALDLWAYPDGRYLVLDGEEFDELAATTYRPEDAAAARAAIAELIDLATSHRLPGRTFDGLIPSPLPSPKPGAP
ncbi:MAG: DUF402 domain-containing protein [Chloroflexi bacterium]|nr:DUF402 domain-containing protein [Chloroflexota bacterium]